MKNTILASLMVIAASLVTFTGFSAELQYNGFTGEYEWTQSGDVMKYNGFDNSYSYENPNSTLQYNGFDNSYSYQY